MGRKRSFGFASTSTTSIVGILQPHVPGGGSATTTYDDHGEPRLRRHVPLHGYGAAATPTPARRLRCAKEALRVHLAMAITSARPGGADSIRFTGWARRIWEGWASATHWASPMPRSARSSADHAVAPSPPGSRIVAGPGRVFDGGTADGKRGRPGGQRSSRHCRGAPRERSAPAFSERRVSAENSVVLLFERGPNKAVWTMLRMPHGSLRYLVGMTRVSFELIDRPLLKECSPEPPRFTHQCRSPEPRWWTQAPQLTQVSHRPRSSRSPSRNTTRSLGGRVLLLPPRSVTFHRVRVEGPAPSWSG